MPLVAGCSMSCRIDACSLVVTLSVALLQSPDRRQHAVPFAHAPLQATTPDNKRGEESVDSPPLGLGADDMCGYHQPVNKRPHIRNPYVYEILSVCHRIDHADNAGCPAMPPALEMPFTPVPTASTRRYSSHDLRLLLWRRDVTFVREILPFIASNVLYSLGPEYSNLRRTSAPPKLPTCTQLGLMHVGGDDQRMMDSRIRTWPGLEFTVACGVPALQAIFSHYRIN